MTLTAKDVAEITQLLEQSSFDELTLELEGLKLTVRRNGAAGPAIPPQRVTPVGAPTADAASAVAAPAHAAPVDAGPAEAAPADAGPTGAPPSLAASDLATQNVTAPLLGTFYRAPKPGAPPFVEVGSAVAEDTIIGIIEVMKLMNTVRAGTRGRVVDIPATDGALVEYGQTLIRVSEEVPR